jgi:hypothetical protein
MDKLQNLNGEILVEAKAAEAESGSMKMAA